MEQESPTNNVTRTPALIRSDLEPMYQLSDHQYEAIINQLTNILLDMIGRLHAAGDGEQACFLAGQTRSILLDYDDDVAEHVRHLAQEHGRK